MMLAMSKSVHIPPFVAAGPAGAGLCLDSEVEGPEAELTVGVELTVRVGADYPV